MIGVWTNQNPWYQGFTSQDQQNNGRQIWGYFQSKGWSIDAVAGMLGNIQYESYVNPGQWQEGHTIEDPTPQNDTGFGLVQWTPWQKYVDSSPYFGDWQAGPNWRTDYNKQLYRIEYERQYDILHPNQGQWVKVVSQGEYLSFYEYSITTLNATACSHIFFDSYERGTWTDYRAYNANYWKQYLEQYGPLPLGDKIPIWLLFKLKGANFS